MMEPARASIFEVPECPAADAMCPLSDMRLQAGGF